MSALHSLPSGSRPDQAIRNNGPDELAIERYKLRELSEGWPCYRDACEWQNFRSIFEADAWVYTSWSGKVHIDDFIQASKEGMDRGAFIMHRVHGSTTDINSEATRAVTKMKATITQRFILDGCEVDAESDCRFLFLFRKDASSGNWAARYVRHWYEKDKLIPVDPRKVPALDDQVLQRYSPGYRYLAYCQQVTMGIDISTELPGHNRGKGTVNGDKHDLLYWHAKEWLEGRDVSF
jgi:hypothetical protein